MFNALKYTQELEKAGFTRKQAEISLNLLIEAMTENFATKTDLKELEFKMESRFQTLETKMESGFRELESRIIIKLGALMVTLITLAVGTSATLFKLIQSSGN